MGKSKSVDPFPVFRGGYKPYHFNVNFLKFYAFLYANAYSTLKMVYKVKDMLTSADTQNTQLHMCQAPKSQRCRGSPSIHVN